VRSGLALIEVLVAVAVFFGGIAAILHAFAAAAAALEAAADTRRADALLQERLAQIELGAAGEMPLPGDAEGAAEGNRGYRCEANATGLSDAGGATRTEWTVAAWREGGSRRHRVCTWRAGAPP
jgi:Tfp pilus assembly protein PilV